MCGLQFLLADLVPHWEELFDYHPYAIKHDSARPKTPLQDSEIERILQMLKQRSNSQT